MTCATTRPMMLGASASLPPLRPPATSSRLPAAQDKNFPFPPNSKVERRSPGPPPPRRWHPHCACRLNIVHGGEGGCYVAGSFRWHEAQVLLNLFPPPYGLQSQGPWKSGGHSLSLEACASGSRRGGRPGGHARRAAREAGRAAWARSAGEGTTGRAACGAGGVRGGRAPGRGRRGQGRSRMRWHGGSQRRRPTAWAAYRAGGLAGGRPSGWAANGAGGLPGGRPSAPAGEPHRRAADWAAGLPGGRRRRGAGDRAGRVTQCSGRLAEAREWGMWVKGCLFRHR